MKLASVIIVGLSILLFCTAGYLYVQLHALPDDSGNVVTNSESHLSVVVENTNRYLIRRIDNTLDILTHDKRFDGDCDSLIKFRKMVVDMNKFFSSAIRLNTNQDSVETYMNRIAILLRQVAELQGYGESVSVWQEKLSVVYKLPSDIIPAMCLLHQADMISFFDTLFVARHTDDSGLVYKDLREIVSLTPDMVSAFYIRNRSVMQKLERQRVQIGFNNGYVAIFTSRFKSNWFCKTLPVVVKLDAPGFGVTPYAPESQTVVPYDISFWEYDLTPVNTGLHKISFHVFLVIDGKEIPMSTIVRSIVVRSDIE